MSEDQKRKIIEKVANLDQTEQATIMGVIRGIELAKTINRTSHQAKKENKEREING